MLMFYFYGIDFIINWYIYQPSDGLIKLYSIDCNANGDG